MTVVVRADFLALGHGGVEVGYERAHVLFGPTEADGRLARAMARALVLRALGVGEQVDTGEKTAEVGVDALRQREHTLPVLVGSGAVEGEEHELRGFLARVQLVQPRRGYRRGRGLGAAARLRGRAVEHQKGDEGQDQRDGERQRRSSSSDRCSAGSRHSVVLSRSPTVRAATCENARRAGRADHDLSQRSAIIPSGSSSKIAEWS
ncbi:hypothetical protein ACWEOE_27525 [Amycolatopsis sp. NPDC004368]